MARPRATFEPATSERWPDLVELFGRRGACGGCWCMELRLARADFDRVKGAGARRALKRRVDSARPPGLLGYACGEPVAWVSVEPREAFRRLATSRVLAPVDDAPVWSINCLFVRADQRRRGLSVAAIRAAVDHARAHGATCVEAYPTDPRRPDVPAAFAYTGLLAAYLEAGFREVLRRSATRPIVRRRLRPAVARGARRRA